MANYKLIDQDKCRICRSTYKIPDSDLDTFEMADGKHGYSVETIGE